MANGQFTADIPGAVQRGLQFRQQEQLRPLQIQEAQQGLQRQQQQFQTGGLQQQALQQQIDQRTDQQKNQSLLTAALNVDALPDDQIVSFLDGHIANVEKQGGDASASIKARDLAKAGNFDEVRTGAKNLIDIGVRQGDILAAAQPKGFTLGAGQTRFSPGGEVVATGAGKPAAVSAAESEFKSLTMDLTKEQVAEATLIKLGLSPRAIGSAIQTISAKGIEEQIGKASATIKQREKFGAMTGASRAKAIDKGVETISKIDAGLRNIDSAVKLLNEGAGVGAIERFLPSFKAASVALDNVQKSMALDVIGSVTFGALSEGELNLAKEVALPTGLDTPQLIEHLQSRKAAQEKLRAYYNEQIQFLDQGGTVAGFLRSKEREQDAQQPATPQQPQQAASPSGKQGGVLHTDAQGNRAMVFPDGSFEEVQ